MFDYQFGEKTAGVPEVDFGDAREMQPYLAAPDAMYVGAPGKPFVFTNCMTGEGIDELVDLIFKMALFDKA